MSTHLLNQAPFAKSAPCGSRAGPGVGISIINAILPNLQTPRLLRSHPKGIFTPYWTKLWVLGIKKTAKMDDFLEKFQTVSLPPPRDCLFIDLNRKMCNITLWLRN